MFQRLLTIHPAVLVVLITSANGCISRRNLRPVAAVRQLAADAIACGEPAEVRRLSSNYDQRTTRDAYEARGCGRHFYASCARPGEQGDCVVVPQPPVQGVPPGGAVATVRVMGLHKEVPPDADLLWEHISLGDGVSDRFLDVGEVTPVTFAIVPGRREISLSTGPSRMGTEIRTLTFTTHDTITRWHERYRRTTTHTIAYQVPVLRDDDGCTAQLVIDARPDAVYLIGYVANGGQCTIGCREVTDSGSRSCTGAQAVDERSVS